jgi:23S rRNA (guanosine2251-2'-O)-methyltransferase
MRKLKVEELHRISVEEFKRTTKNPIVIILDNVRSMNNVGSAFRTADAFLIEKICICGITAAPPHRDINKTALGATESVKWSYYKNTIEAIKEYKKKKYSIYSIEQAEGSTPLQSLEFIEAEDKYCLVFGNEVFGVAEEVLKVSDKCLEIPQFGTKHSLNISVSIGIVVWSMLERIKF